MIVLLFATYFGETFGRYIYLNKLAASNHFVYNTLLIVQVSIFHIMFAHLFRQYNISKVPLLAGLAILSIKYVYDVFNKSFWIFSQDTYTLLSVLIVLYGFIFYYYLLTDDSYIDLKYSSAFWWVSGIMIFCFGSMACNIFEERLNHVMVSGHHLAYYIFRVLNVFLYGFWSFSFICRKWLSPAQGNMPPPRF